MNEIPLIFFLWVGAFLFATGLSIILIKRNVIFVLMGVELMLNAANLNLIAFSRGDDQNQGLMMAKFISTPRNILAMCQRLRGIFISGGINPRKNGSKTANIENWLRRYFALSKNYCCSFGNR